MPVAANRQPALAVYSRAAGAKEFKAWAIVLLSVEDGSLREIATFASPEIFVHFNVPTARGRVRDQPLARSRSTALADFEFIQLAESGTL